MLFRSAFTRRYPLANYNLVREAARANSPLEFVLQGNSARRFNSSLTFSLIMNLVPAVGTADRDLLWRYMVTYDPALAEDAETEALARVLMECALNFYRDLVEPAKQVYTPSAAERDQLRALAEFLGAHPEAPGEEIEKAIYDLGRAHYEKPGQIFPLIYRTLLGQERGPRLGAFIRLATPAKIAQALASAIG